MVLECCKIHKKPYLNILKDVKNEFCNSLGTSNEYRLTESERFVTKGA